MTDPQFWWYLARATGVVAWALLTTTVVWGLLLRTRLATRWVPPAWTADVHRFLALLATLFTGAHLTGLLLDDYIQLGLADLAVPFASDWRPVPVALGVLAAYLLGGVVASSLLMHRLPRRWWHRIHLSSYLLFWLATMHGITAGTDSGSATGRVAVATAVVVVLLLTVVRTVRTPTAPARGPRFHRLTVTEVRRETADAVSVAFAVPGRLTQRYRFRPGQHLLVRTPLGGAPVTRPYSVCSGVSDGELRIAVRGVPGGRMSTWMTTELRAGDVLEVAEPAGDFAVELDPGRSRHVLGVAAGSGITPVLSIVASVLAIEPASRCTLVYGNRTAAGTLFSARLAALADRHPGRLRVVHVRSREAVRPPGLTGRISGGALHAVHRGGSLADVSEAFVCGPPAMTTEVRRALVEEFGLPPERVRTEVFSSAPTTIATPATGARRTVVVRAGSRDHAVTVAPGESVLDAGLRAGLDLPYSCRAGVCGTCTARAVPASGRSRGEAVLTCRTPAPEGDVLIDFNAVGDQDGSELRAAS